MITHTCSYDEESCQVLDAEGSAIVFDPKCPCCKAEQAAPELFDCVVSFVRRFGAAVECAVECDEEINGEDAVDWISENMPKFRNALKKARGLR